jgi:hypothetical protein
MTFAARQSLLKPEDPAAKPIDFSDINKIGDQLQARFTVMRAMQDRYQAPAKPLTREEVDALSGALKAAPVAQKTQIFSQLVNASGNDFDGYKAMVAQIAPDDPVTAHAGIMAGRGRMSTDAGFKPDPGQATNVAQLILQGQAVLRPNRKEDGTRRRGSSGRCRRTRTSTRSGSPTSATPSPASPKRETASSRPPRRSTPRARSSLAMGLGCSIPAAGTRR